MTSAPQIKSHFDPKKPFLVNNNGGTDSAILYRSLFTKWNRGIPQYLPPTIHYAQNDDSIQLLGASLSELYKYAFIGELSWRPPNILYKEVFPYVILDNGKHIVEKASSERYCYSLWISDNSHGSTLQKRFQYDLESQFGYRATVEYRQMPYYSLSIREGYLKKILSKKEETRANITHAGFTLQKSPISRVIGILAQKFQQELPFIDDTGLSNPIDLSIETIMTDFTEVKKALYEKGINLQLSLKPMRVIVLRPKEINVTAS